MKLKSNWAYMFAILLFTNCGGGDKATTTEGEKPAKTEEEAPVPEKEEKKATTAKLLVGDWELVKETNMGGEENKGAKGKLNFTKDSFIEITGEGKESGVLKGKYKLGKSDQTSPNAIDGLEFYEEGKEMIAGNGMPYSIIAISKDELVIEFMGRKTYKRK